jgi:hypothetical protein
VGHPSRAVRRREEYLPLKKDEQPDDDGSFFAKLPKENDGEEVLEEEYVPPELSWLAQRNLVHKHACHKHRFYYLLHGQTRARRGLL